MTIQSYSGPVPLPETLRAYNDGIENGADRVLAMAERQAKHRQEMERLTLESNIRRTDRGLNYGLYIAVAGFVVVLILSLTGHDQTAQIIGVTGLVSLVSVFVLGRRSLQRSFEEKMRAIAGVFRNER